MRGGSFALVPLLAATLLLTGCSRERSGPPRTQEETVVPVAVERVATGSFRHVVRAMGTVVAAEGSEFLAVAPQPARVLEVVKEAGDPVASGEVLVRFELPSAAENVTRQRAELARVQAQLESARVNRTRVRDFVERGLVPRVDLEAADREVVDAEALLERARKAADEAEEIAAAAIVRAPFDGIVAQRLHNPGDLAQGTLTDPVLRVVDPRRLEVHAAVEANEAAHVLPSATARFISPTDAQPVALLVLATPPSASFTSDGSLPVRLSFVTPPTVPVDTRVDVEIDGHERADVMFVPTEAVVRDGTGAAVMVAAGDRAERRAITIGEDDGDRVEIVSGVRPGELVITRGHVGLRGGEKISVRRLEE